MSCQNRTTLISACDSDEDCRSSAQCLEGYCHANCDPDNECGMNTKCHKSSCHLLCEASYQCLGNQRCDTGTGVCIGLTPVEIGIVIGDGRLEGSTASWYQHTGLIS